jgi:hypothetical protein
VSAAASGGAAEAAAGRSSLSTTGLAEEALDLAPALLPRRDACFTQAHPSLSIILLLGRAGAWKGGSWGLFPGILQRLTGRISGFQRLTGRISVVVGCPPFSVAERRSGEEAMRSAFELRPGAPCFGFATARTVHRARSSSASSSSSCLEGQEEDMEAAARSLPRFFARCLCLCRLCRLCRRLIRLQRTFCVIDRNAQI